jgi:hypothetical protein
MATLYLRLLEWCADSSQRVQYPLPREKEPSTPPLRVSWRHSMPMYVRVSLALICAAVFVFSVVVIGALAVVLWSLIR